MSHLAPAYLQAIKAGVGSMANHLTLQPFGKTTDGDTAGSMADLFVQDVAKTRQFNWGGTVFICAYPFKFVRKTPVRAILLDSCGNYPQEFIQESARIPEMSARIPNVPAWIPEVPTRIPEDPARILEAPTRITEAPQEVIQGAKKKPQVPNKSSVGKHRTRRAAATVAEKRAAERAKMIAIVSSPNEKT